MKKYAFRGFDESPQWSGYKLSTRARRAPLFLAFLEAERRRARKKAAT